MSTCGYILHRLNPLLTTKLGSFLVRYTFPPARLRPTLAGAIRSNHVAACSTALRNATEQNESGGYVAVPSPSNFKQPVPSA